MVGFAPTRDQWRSVLWLMAWTVLCLYLLSAVLQTARWQDSRPMFRVISAFDMRQGQQVFYPQQKGWIGDYITLSTGRSLAEALQVIENRRAALPDLTIVEEAR